jgi:hypothetical protein
VAIALAIQGTHADDATTETNLERAPAAETADAKPPQPARPIPRGGPARPEKTNFAVGAAVVALVDAGALPSVAPGGSVELFFELGPARFIAFGAAFVPQEERLSDGSGARFELVLGGGAACLLRERGAFRLAGCAAFEAGAMSAEGFGVTRPGQETVPWLAPRIEARAELVLTNEVRLMLGVGATFPLTRHNFVLNQVQPLHRASAVTARGMAGVLFLF